MRNTSNVPNGGRARGRLYAMMSQEEKAVFDRWARRIGASYIAVTALLVVVTTMAVPSSEKSAATSLGSTSTRIAAHAKPERPNVQASRSEAAPDAKRAKRN